MSLAQVKDQDVALRLLRNLLERNRVPHGMLFWGPSGVGKRMAAMEFAKALLCKQGGVDACDECLTCRKLMHGNHPDVKVISPAGKTRIIKVDTIAEEVIELSAYQPYEADWRVFILQDAERLNVAAQTKFLKTLEEPPGRSLFILLSEAPRMLLPTIRSRCLSVRFRSLNPETVAAMLREQRDLPEDLSHSIAALSQGQMTRALDLVESEKREIVLAVVKRLGEGEDPFGLCEDFLANLEDQRKALETTVGSKLSKEERSTLTPKDLEDLKEQQDALIAGLLRGAMLEYLYLLETWYRDELVYKVTSNAEALLNKDQTALIEAHVSTHAGAKVLAIERARRFLNTTIPFDRVFRDLFFTLAEA